VALSGIGECLNDVGRSDGARLSKAVFGPTLGKARSRLMQGLDGGISRAHRRALNVAIVEIRLPPPMSQIAHICEIWPG
jgi:hypothetical protein